MINIIDTNEFDEFINENELVVTDFWAPWCGPCRMLSSVIDKLYEVVDYAKFVKVNVDEAKDLASKYNIQTLPTVIIFKRGREIASKSGFMSQSVLMDLIETNG